MLNYAIFLNVMFCLQSPGDKCMIMKHELSVYTSRFEVKNTVARKNLLLKSINEITFLLTVFILLFVRLRTRSIKAYRNKRRCKTSLIICPSIRGN